MGIIKTFKGASIRIPGFYSWSEVSQPGGLPLAATGVVGIIGEAYQGAPGSVTGPLQYDSSTMNSLIAYYGSGPIVDAARALINASNDKRVAQGASQIFVYKTNASTQAALSLSSWGSLTSKNYGLLENLINVVIQEDTAENFVLQFGVDWSAQPASNVSFRVNGGAIVAIDKTNCDTAANTVTELNSKFNTALGTVGVVYASKVVNRISLNLSSAHRDSMGICLELIASAEWVKLGVSVPQQGVAIVAGSLVRGLTAANPTRSVVVNRQMDNVTEDSDSSVGELAGVVYMNIGCNAATSAVLSITGIALSIVASGAGASSLSVNLSDYKTLGDLAEYISAQTGYVCSIPEGVNSSLPPTVLDRVSSVGICASTSLIPVGQVKADSYEVQRYFDLNSQLVSCVRTSHIGLPAVMAKTFLSGAVRGASSTSRFQAGFTAFESIRINEVIPLISQDATDDLIEDGDYTDAGSDYDIESVIAQLREHCKKMCSIENRSERNGYAGYRGTFAECKNEARRVASETVSLCIEDSLVMGVTGVQAYAQPHITACLVAGLQAGAEVGEPSTFKYVQADGLKHIKKQGVTPSILEIFDPALKGHKDQAIDSGILVLDQPSSGGVRVVLANTTYQKDDNFVYNRVSVLDAANYVAFNLRKHCEDVFTGTKAKTGSAESIRNFIIAEMANFLAADLIVGDDLNKQLGYKNLSVVQNGNTANISVTITPVQGEDFGLIEFSLANIKQTA